MIDIEASLADSAHQYHLGMVKTAADTARYERVLASVQPSLIVEAGTFSGKSALWFAQHAAVVTCDTDPHIDPPTDLVLHRQPHPVRLVTAMSTSAEFVQAVQEEMRAHPGPVLVSLDGDHSAATVLAELEALAPYAAYLVCEDTLLRWMPAAEQAHYTGTPADAVDAWLPDHPEWEIDVETEALSTVTQFPGGWLRRVAP